MPPSCRRDSNRPRRAVVIVPVLYKPTKAEAAEAAKQCRFLIKAPSRAAQYLTTIAEAVCLARRRRRARADHARSDRRVGSPSPFQSRRVRNRRGFPSTAKASCPSTFQSLTYGGHFDEHGIKLRRRRAVARVCSASSSSSTDSPTSSRSRRGCPTSPRGSPATSTSPSRRFLRERYEHFRLEHPHAVGHDSRYRRLYATFQDFQFSLRYNLIEQVFVVTPSLGGDHSKP